MLVLSVEGVKLQMTGGDIHIWHPRSCTLWDTGAMTMMSSIQRPAQTDVLLSETMCKATMRSSAGQAAGYVIVYK